MTAQEHRRRLKWIEAFLRALDCYTMANYLRDEVMPIVQASSAKVAV